MTNDKAENSIMQTISIAVSAILIAAGLVTAPGLINNARDNNARTDLANIAYAQEYILGVQGKYFDGEYVTIEQEMDGEGITKAEATNNLQYLASTEGLNGLGTSVALADSNGGVAFSVSGDVSGWASTVCDTEPYFVIKAQSGSGKWFYRGSGSGLTSSNYADIYSKIPSKVFSGCSSFGSDFEETDGQSNEPTICDTTSDGLKANPSIWDAGSSRLVDGYGGQLTSEFGDALDLSQLDQYMPAHSTVAKDGTTWQPGPQTDPDDVFFCIGNDLVPHTLGNEGFTVNDFSSMSGPVQTYIGNNFKLCEGWASTMNAWARDGKMIMMFDGVPNVYSLSTDYDPVSPMAGDPGYPASCAEEDLSNVDPECAYSGVPVSLNGSGDHIYGWSLTAQTSYPVNPNVEPYATYLPFLADAEPGVGDYNVTDLKLCIEGELVQNVTYDEYSYATSYVDMGGPGQLYLNELLFDGISNERMNAFGNSGKIIFHMNNGAQNVLDIRGSGEEISPLDDGLPSTPIAPDCSVGTNYAEQYGGNGPYNPSSGYTIIHGEYNMTSSSWLSFSCSGYPIPEMTVSGNLPSSAMNLNQPSSWYETMNYSLDFPSQGALEADTLYEFQVTFTNSAGSWTSDEYTQTVNGWESKSVQASGSVVGITGDGETLFVQKADGVYECPAAFFGNCETGRISTSPQSRVYSSDSTLFGYVVRTFSDNSISHSRLAGMNTTLSGIGCVYDNDARIDVSNNGETVTVVCKNSSGAPTLHVWQSGAGWLTRTLPSGYSMQLGYHHVDVANASFMATMVGNTIYLSHDGGVSWSASRTISESFSGGDACVFDTTNYSGNVAAFSCYSNSRSYVYVTYDGGTTWLKNSFMGKAYSLSVDDERINITDHSGNIYTGDHVYRGWTPADSYYASAFNTWTTNHLGGVSNFAYVGKTGGVMLRSSGSNAYIVFEWSDPSLV